MSAIEPLAPAAPPSATARRHLRPVTSRSAPQRRKNAATKAPDPAPPPTSLADLPNLSTQLQTLERELRQTWSAMLELDAAQAGRLGHAGRLVHQASIVLGDHSAIY